MEQALRHGAESPSSDGSGRASPSGLARRQLGSPFLSGNGRKSKHGWSKLKLAVNTVSVLNDVQSQRRDALNKWESMKSAADERKRLLLAAKQLQIYQKDIAEADTWIKDKHDAIASSDTSVADVKIRLQQHQATVAETEAYRKHIDDLIGQAKTAQNDGHPAAGKFQQAAERIDKVMVELEKAVEAKGTKLNINSQQFLDLNKFMDITSSTLTWCEETTKLISALQTAEELAAATALAERHQETVAEVKAREHNVTVAEDFGGNLLAQGHYAADEITAQLSKLIQAYKTTSDLAESKRIIFKQSLELQQFLKLTAQVADWLEVKQQALEEAELGSSQQEVTSLIKKHDAFEKDLAAQQERMREVDSLVDQAKTVEHYEVHVFTEHQTELHQRQEELLALSHKHSAALQDSKAYQSLSRDHDETMQFIRDRLDVARDESYRDPSNLATKLKQHQTFAVELQGYKAHVNDLLDRVSEMVDRGHFAHATLVKMAEELEGEWKALQAAADDKGRRLKEAEKLAQFNKIANDLHAWLDDVEQYVAQPELGIDVKSVEALLKRQEEVEQDLASREARVEGLLKKAQSFAENGHFDSEAATERAQVTQDRYDMVIDPLQARRANLESSRDLQQFLLDVKAQETWIQLKRSLVQSKDYGDTLSAAQIFDVRAKGFESELQTRQQAIMAVSDKADNLVQQNHYAGAQIVERKKQLLDQWDALTLDADTRKQKLAENLRLQMFLVDHREASAVLGDLEVDAGKQDLGTNIFSVKELIKQHEQVMEQVETINLVVKELRAQCNDLITTNNLGHKDADKSTRSIEAALERLNKTTKRRHLTLEDALLWQTFRQQAEEVLEWLNGSVEEASNRDCGTTVEENRLLRKRFEDFEQDRLKSEPRVIRVEEQAAKLSNNNQLTLVVESANKVKQAWADLRAKIDLRGKLLSEAASLLAFHRDADETMEWISEKEVELKSDDFGQDKDSVMVLMRKHQTLERDLAVLGAKLEQVFAEAGRLVAVHPTHAQPITNKQSEMATRWEVMQDTAAARKEYLSDAFNFYKFVADAREILAWHVRMTDAMAAMEPAADVPDAERQLEKHLELRMQIEAHQPAVEDLLDVGEGLLDGEQAHKDAIQQVLAEVGQAQTELSQTWDSYNELLQESVFIQEFHRDAAECEAWIDGQTTFLQGSDAELAEADIETMMKKFEDFEKTLMSQSEKVDRLTSVAKDIESELTSGELKGLYQQNQQDVRRGSVFEAAKRRPTLDSMTKRRPSTTANTAKGGLDFKSLQELRQNVQAEYKRRAGETSNKGKGARLSPIIGSPAESPEISRRGSSLAQFRNEPTRDISPLRPVAVVANAGASPSRLAQATTVHSTDQSIRERLAGSSSPLMSNRVNKTGTPPIDVAKEAAATQHGEILSADKVPEEAALTTMTQMNSANYRAARQQGSPSLDMADIAVKNVQDDVSEDLDASLDDLVKPEQPPPLPEATPPMAMDGIATPAGVIDFTPGPVMFGDEPDTMEESVRRMTLPPDAIVPPLPQDDDDGGESSDESDWDELV